MITDLLLNVGGSEWIVIILLAMFLLFGAKKLPQVSKSLGRVMGEYQKAKNTVQEEMQKVSKVTNSSPFKLDGTMKSTTTTTTPTTSTTASTNVQATASPQVSAEVKAEDAASAGINGPVVSEREKLETIAKTLEIEPRGKSTEELKQLISGKMNQ